MIKIIMLLPLLIGGLGCLKIGANIIRKKRPLVISTRLYAFIVLVIPCGIGLMNLTKGWITAGDTYLPERYMSIILIANTCIYVLIAVMCVLIWGGVWRVPNSYTVIGIKSADFQESIRAVLKNFNIQFHEDEKAINLTRNNIRLELKGVKSITPTIRITDKSHTTWHKDFSRSLQEYYNYTPLETAPVYSIFLFMIGIVFLSLFLISSIKILVPYH